MSRDLHPANSAAIDAARVRPIGLFEAEFRTGTIHLWTGVGDLEWGGRVWRGAGALLAFGGIEETNAVVASGATVTLSGIPLDLVQLAIIEAEQGAPGRLWLGLMDEHWQLVADPEVLFAGLLDVPALEEGEDTASLTISYENRLNDLQRPRQWRYTDESQQQLHPGDKGFAFVTSIQDVELTWGR